MLRVNSELQLIRHEAPELRGHLQRILAKSVSGSSDPARPRTIVRDRVRDTLAATRARPAGGPGGGARYDSADAADGVTERLCTMTDAR